MQMSGNTILITGGGTGIGRGLAEAFHKEGNQVIIAGRRQGPLDETTGANPGMRSETLDIGSSVSIQSFAERMRQEYPALNAVIHNAGIMRSENLLGDGPTEAEATVNINLLGPIRLDAALLPHLRSQPRATVLTVSSGLAFVPLAPTPTYCATKAALHSYTESLRYQLRKTNVQVIELIPPYVQTELGGARQATDPNAMPLDEFIAETMRLLRENPDAPEINVERVKPLRFAAESGSYAQVFQHLNEAMANRSPE